MAENDVACSDHFQNRMVAKLDGEDAALHELRLMADAAESDIVRDFPEVDKGYDFYAERLCLMCNNSSQRSTALTANGRELARHERAGTPCQECQGGKRRPLVGVIDMGDLYQQAFEWDGEQWNPLSEDAAVVRDLIIDQRTSR